MPHQIASTENGNCNIYVLVITNLWHTFYALLNWVNIKEIL